MANTQTLDESRCRFWCGLRMVLLAVCCDSFFLICVSSPMAWALACVCCVGLCACFIPKKTREFAAEQMGGTYETAADRL